MSKKVEKITLYSEAAKMLNLNLSDQLIINVTTHLGPSIYKKDAEIVSCSDSTELDTVKKNFLQKKLGLTQDDATLDAAIKKACEAMGSSNSRKYRVLFYALLAKEFGKESVYA